MKTIYRLLFLILAAASLAAQSPEDIIRRMEENRVHDSAYSEGRMITTDKYGTITRTFRSWARGEDETLIEFTSKGEEGQKILRTADEIYLYFPDSEDVLRIQGSAMRDSVMDSDFSYEDMTGDKGLLADYTARLQGDESVDGHDTWIVELTAKNRSVPYYRQIVWVDKERYIGLKVHKFSRSGTLLKEMEVLRTEEIDGKTIPTRMVMRDKMKKDSQTEFIVDELDLGVSLDPSRFSLEELTW